MRRKTRAVLRVSFSRFEPQSFCASTRRAFPKKKLPYSYDGAHQRKNCLFKQAARVWATDASGCAPRTRRASNATWRVAPSSRSSCPRSAAITRPFPSLSLSLSLSRGERPLFFFFKNGVFFSLPRRESSRACLCSFAHPVLFEEKPYGGAPTVPRVASVLRGDAATTLMTDARADHHRATSSSSSSQGPAPGTGGAARCDEAADARHTHTHASSASENARALPTWDGVRVKLSYKKKSALSLCA